MNSLTKDAYTENGWSYAIPTPVLIDGKPHTVQMANGMTGICSRQFWIDGKGFDRKLVTQSGDLTKGNHFLYMMKWRDQPWDKVYILIHEDELPMLLNEENKWREPRKVEIAIPNRLP